MTTTLISDLTKTIDTNNAKIADHRRRIADLVRLNRPLLKQRDKANAEIARQARIALLEQMRDAVLRGDGSAATALANQLEKGA